MNPRDVLTRYPLFALAPPALLDEWILAGQTFTCQAGEPLFQEGSSGAWIYLLLHGRVRLFRQTSAGREITLGTLNPGEVFGEYALIPPGNNTASCRAASNSVLLQIPLILFRAWFASQFPAASKLKNWFQLNFLVRYLRGQAFLGFMSAPSILAMLPCLGELTLPPLRTLQADGLGEDQWYYVQSGEVLVTGDGPARSLEAGACLGERALLGERLSYTAVTMAPTTVLSLDREAFRHPGQHAGQHQAQSYSAEFLDAPDRIFWIGQRESADCGAASLAMIAYYHELPWTIEQIRSRLAIGPEGATLGEMTRMATVMGLRAQPARVGAAQLRHLHVPAIIHLTGNHYVVLFRLDEHGAHLGDPARGILRVSLIHFAQLTSGQVLLVRPAPARSF